MLFAYKITGDTSNKCEFCDTQEEADALQVQGYFISLVEINWSEKRMPVFGVLEDIPVTPPDPPYVPTEKEIKRQKLAMLAMEYYPQFKQLDLNAISAKVLDNDIELFNSIISEKEVLMKEYLEKMEVIRNG